MLLSLPIQALQSWHLFIRVEDMILDISQYNSLKLHEKVVLLGGDAIFLLNMVDTGILYSLYAYRNFYIEVLIDEESSNLIEVIAFHKTTRIDKYLETIIMVGF